MAVISTLSACISFYPHLHFQIVHCFNSHLHSIMNYLKLQQIYYTRDNLDFKLCPLSSVLNEHNISETSSFILLEYVLMEKVQKFCNYVSTYAN